MNKTAQRAGREFRRNVDHATGEPRLVSAAEYRMTNRAVSSHITQRSWLFEFYVTGELDVDVAGTGWRLCRPGMASLHPPGTAYRERLPSAARGPCVSQCVLFDAGDSQPLERGPAAPPCAWVEDPDDVVRPLMDRLIQAWDLGSSGRLVARGCFLQLLGMLLLGRRKGATITVIDRPHAEQDMVSRAHEFMRRNLARNLSVGEVARHVGLTESGFAHAYRRGAGQSPMAMLRSMRVEAARFRFLRSGLSLAQIATETGFADGFHLSRVFKKITGSSPREFRRLMR